MTESHSLVLSSPPPKAPGLQTNVPAMPGGRHSSDSGSTNESTIIVVQAPPALQRDSVRNQPSLRHVWIAGYWIWQNDQYEWMAGHWEEPPGSFTVWVRPSWERDGDAYRFHAGYWN